VQGKEICVSESFAQGEGLLPTVLCPFALIFAVAGLAEPLLLSAGRASSVIATSIFLPVPSWLTARTLFIRLHGEMVAGKLGESPA